MWSVVTGVWRVSFELSGHGCVEDQRHAPPSLDGSQDVLKRALIYRFSMTWSLELAIPEMEHFGVNLRVEAPSGL